MVRTGSITSSGAHGYLAAPVQHGGEPPAELEVPAPFGLNCPGPAVAAELSVGVDARPEGPSESLGHVTKGELRREQALVCWCSHPSDTLNPHERPFTGMLDVTRAQPPAAAGALFPLPLGGPPFLALA